MKIAFAFGRMNPMHIGHELVVDSMAENSDKALLYLSHKQNPKTDPLDYDTKIEWAKKAFGHEADAVRSDKKTFLEALAEVYDIHGGDNDILFVSGSDRSAEAEIAKKYNGIESKHGYYKFNSITPFIAGAERINEDDVQVEKASGTKQREFAAIDDLESFKEYCPSHLTDDEKEELFRDVKHGMGLVEELSELNEAPMSYDDIVKHDYYDRVVNDLESSGVKLKNGSTAREKDATVIKNLKSLNKVQDKKDRADNFNAIAGFRWTEIDKAPYSGKGGDAGQSAGENAEAAVCYYYNFGNKADDNLVSSKNVNAAWIKSSKNTAGRIAKEWPRSKWVAVHVNGRDFAVADQNYLNAAKLFNSKTAAESVLDLKGGTLNDLYSSGKDTWNKADIVLVRRGVNVISELKKLKIKNSKEYNNALVKMSKAGPKQILAPLSLKGTGTKTVDQIIIKPEGFSNSDHVKITDVKLYMPTSVKEDSNNCTCYLKGEDEAGNIYTIQFRRQSDTEDSINIEIAYKNARGGKATSSIKNKLGLSGNEWYQSFRFANEKDLIAVLAQYFDIANMPGKDLNKFGKKAKYPWYNRTCFRALVALYERYVELHGDDVESFFELVFNSATQGTGAFYLVM